MIYIPSILFSILAFIIYKKSKSINLAVWLSIVYAISGVFSILIDNKNLYSFETKSYQISLEASLIYMVILSFTIYAISSFNLPDIIKMKSIKRIRLFKFCSIFVFIWFITSFILGFNDMISVYLSDEMFEIKKSVYEGTKGPSWMLSLPPLVRLFYAIFNILFSCTWALIYIGIYSLTLENMSFKYGIMWLIASLSGPVSGIIGADRSQTAYWVLSLLMCIIPMWKCLSNNAKKRISVLLFGMFIFFSIYIINMTISRFSDRYAGGAFDSVISYLGQSYINFCYFFDNYKLPYEHWGILFPFISIYIFGIPAGGVPIQEEMSLLSGKFTGVFYTYIGHWMIALGQYWAIFISVLYIILIKIVSRKFNYKTLYMDDLYRYLFVVSLIFLGLFTYYYAGVGRLVSAVFLYCFIKYIK